MGKRRKIPKKYKEEYEEEPEKISINRIEMEENEGPVSVNRKTEEELFEKKVVANKGRKAPVPEDSRDPEMDKEPISEEDLGLPEDNFLIDRQVRKLDLLLHMNAQEKFFLGTNVRKIRDFVSIFDKGKSSKDDPKIDMEYEIDQNTEFKKELIAQQLLRNFHSRRTREVRNTTFIFKQMGLWDDSKEELSDFKEKLEENDEAFQDEQLIAFLQNRIPYL